MMKLFAFIGSFFISTAFAAVPAPRLNTKTIPLPKPICRIIKNPCRETGCKIMKYCITPTRTPSPTTAPSPTPSPSPSPSPSPTPVPMSISAVNVKDCNVNESCYGTKTSLDVWGFGFDASTRVKVREVVQGSPEFAGSYISGTSYGNQGYKITTDFTNLPNCQHFDVIAYSNSVTTTFIHTITTTCPATMFSMNPSIPVGPYHTGDTLSIPVQILEKDGTVGTPEEDFHVYARFWNQDPNSFSQPYGVYNSITKTYTVAIVVPPKPVGSNIPLMLDVGVECFSSPNSICWSKYSFRQSLVWRVNPFNTN